MKRIISVFLCAAFLALTMFGCSPKNEKNERLSVVTTIFPIYDWIKNVAGDSDIDASMLIRDGVDLHSYQPTADDMIAISSCDLFVYVGGESDKWVDDALKNRANPDMLVLNLTDSLKENGLKVEELVEGMEAEDEGDLDSDEKEEDPEYDEHIWLSLRLASSLCKTIKDNLIKLDPDNSQKYSENCDNYTEKLSELDEKYYDMVRETDKNTLLFGDRFPFRYLVDDYKLSYYAAFAGCSAETEASFETVAFLAEKLDELELNAVLTIDGSDKKLAKTIIEASDRKDAEIVTVNSMQSVTSEDLESGANYISIMENNLSAFQTALS